MWIPNIVVVGSINMDLVARMARLPRPGETVSGIDFQTIPGGKGANQAVAAARLGASVTMIGRVGDDAFGQSLKQSLAGYGVLTDHVQSTAGCASGVALINVEASGANSIVVIPAANGRLSPADVADCTMLIASADALIVQLETPPETVIAAVETARQLGVRTILDPAPVPSGGIPDALLRVDVISPNQTEAEALTGIVVDGIEAAERAARILKQRGCREVVIKMGEAGAVVVDESGRMEHVAAAETSVVDTTAAGDAFTAGLTIALCEGKSLIEAARFGCAAGTLACMTLGAQPAMPDRAAVDGFLRTGL